MLMKMTKKDSFDCILKSYKTHEYHILKLQFRYEVLISCSNIDYLYSSKIECKNHKRYY
jgi:hypothetical protein